VLLAGFVFDQKVVCTAAFSESLASNCSQAVGNLPIALATALAAGSGFNFCGRKSFPALRAQECHHANQGSTAEERLRETARGIRPC